MEFRMCPPNLSLSLTSTMAGGLLDDSHLCTVCADTFAGFVRGAIEPIKEVSKGDQI